MQKDENGAEPVSSRVDQRHLLPKLRLYERELIQPSSSFQQPGSEFGADGYAIGAGRRQMVIVETKATQQIDAGREVEFVGQIFAPD